MTDRALLFAAAFLRATATAMMAVLLGLYLARRGLDPSALGIVVAAGLAGAATASLVVTLLGDGVGRRHAHMLLTVLRAVPVDAGGFRPRRVPSSRSCARCSPWTAWAADS